MLGKTSVLFVLVSVWDKSIDLLILSIVLFQDLQELTVSRGLKKISSAFSELGNTWGGFIRSSSS